MRLPVIIDGGESCFTCLAPCCTSYAVPLTGFDLWRMTRGLQLPWREVAEVRPDRSAWEGFRLDDSDDRWGLFLRATDGESCAFLMQLPGGQQRCGAHSSRPLACRVYPWKPTESNQLGVEVTPHAMCPPPQRAHFESQKQDARAAIHDELSERPLYKLAVLRWNDHAAEVASSPEDFVRWLLSLYDALWPLRGHDDWRWAAQHFIEEFPIL